MKALRGGIFVLIAFSVLAHGAVEVWSESLLEMGAATLLALWVALLLKHPELKVRWNPLNWPALGFLVIGVGQLVFHQTAYAFLTRTELLKMTSYFIVFFLVAQAFRERADLMKVAWFLILLGFVVSLFGITQAFTSSGEIYWFRKLTLGGDPFGPYVNRNHFAGFAELVIPVALVPLVLGKVRRERWFAVGIFALLPIVALFLSASRGGFVSFAAEIGVLALIMILRRTGGRHVLAGGVVLLLAFMLVSWLGVRQILERFSSMQSLEVSVGKRASMRHDAWHIFLEHPWIGTGLGTLPIVFPAYETLYDGKVVNHAHNDYLEGLAETGIAGGLCGAVFLGILFFVSLRQLLQRDKPFAAALHLSGLVACSGFLVHSLVDFNLHIPANALLFLGF